MYRPETIANLEREIMRRPDHAVVWSCEITHWDPNKAPPKKGWREWKTNAGLCKGFQTAFASAAYRREFFDDLVFDQERAPKGCLHHDDIWFGAHLWLRNVPIYVLDGFGIESNCDKQNCWPVMYHRWAVAQLMCGKKVVVILQLCSCMSSFAAVEQCSALPAFNPVTASGAAMCSSSCHAPSVA
jgi:hypothetical protein